MDTDDLKSLAVRLAALTEHLEQRSQHTMQAVVRSSEQLQQTARGLGLEGQRLAQQAVSTIGTQAGDAVQGGLKQALERCNQALQKAAMQAEQSAAGLQMQQAALQRAQRGMIWKASFGLFVGALLALGTAGYLAWKNWQTAQQASFSVDIVRATQSGALTQCGGVLCVKVPKSAVRYDKNADYVLLRE